MNSSGWWTEVATDGTQTTSFRPSARTKIVWGAFVVGMTMVVGLLSLTSGQSRSGFLMTHVEVVGGGDVEDPVFGTSVAPDDTRWTGIVIHHNGEPAGDGESIRRLHESYGYRGLGYHFLIGNGNGLADGVVQVGYRWDEQLPGVHTTGPEAEQHNQRSIGICLIGNGDRRPFTDRQIETLSSLVARLQERLDIPAHRVVLHRDVSPAASGPGRFFAEGRFRERVIGAVR